MMDSHSDALVFFGATGDLAYKKIFPALHAICSRELGIVCVTAHDRIACIDAQGVRWRSQPIVPDDLTIQTIDQDGILVSGFDPMTQTAVDRWIDLISGQLKRG